MTRKHQRDAQFSSSPRLKGAHHGLRACFSENALPAFETSISRSDFIEFDVRLSSALVPVIIHDSTLNRTSNINDERYLSYLVADYTLTELRKLAWAHFNAGTTAIISDFL